MRLILKVLPALVGVSLVFTTVQAYNCSAGFDCVGEQVVPNGVFNAYVGPGFYSDGSKDVVNFCGSGRYCETSATHKVCPEGKWCPVATVTPLDCEPFSLCSEGSGKFTWLLCLVIGTAAIVVCGIAYQVYLRQQARTNLQIAQMITAQSAHSAARSEDPNLLIHQSTAVMSQQRQDQTFVHASSSASSLRISIELRNVHYEVPVGSGTKRAQGNQKVILESVSACFEPGKVSAIMGPSGSGKSSLLNILLGKVPLSQRSGEIIINEATGLSLGQLSKKGLLGFVPQEDVMLRQLTVREILTHAAFSRLPGTMSRAEKMASVDFVMDLLRIAHVQHSQVGDELKRGISGGERKRVSIAMELVARPTVLILDEPTSGLDATAAHELTDALHRIAMAGVTVITVIHQPRYEIFSAFDSVMLLGSGGRTVYAGPSSAAVDYFMSLGFKYPEDPERVLNPADFIMDILTARIPWVLDDHQVVLRQSPGLEEYVRENETNGGKEINPNILLTPRVISAHLSEIWLYRAKSVESSDLSVLRSTPRDIQIATASRDIPGLLSLVCLYIIRSFWQEVHALGPLLLDVAQQCLPGIGLGIGADDYIPPLNDVLAQMCPYIIRERCENSAVTESSMFNRGFFITMVCIAISGVSSVRTFAYEKDVIARELGSGASGIAYFLGRSLWDVVHIVRISFTFITFFFILASPTGTAAEWFAVIIGMTYAAFGLGYMWSFLVSKDKALIITTVIGVASSVTSGLSPNLNTVSSWGPLIIFWIVSPARWAAEAIITVSVSPYKGNFRVEQSIRKTGYDINHFDVDITMLFVLGTVFRIIAFCIMYWKNMRTLVRS
eukprot:ANDGO_00133.mRNA.1 ABC transporter G family member 28